MKPEEWGEIFEAGRKNLPSQHESPASALGKALMAMESKAHEIQGRYDAAEAQADDPIAMAFAPEPEADSRTYGFSAVRIIRVVKDGVDLQRWVEPIDYSRSIYFARDLAREHEGARILYIDNDNPDKEFGDWIEYNAAPYFPPE